MMRISLGAVPGLLAAMVLAAPAHAAGDAEAGAQKVTTCVACHGPGGVSTNPDYPSLAGQVPGYIEKQLLAFKSGARQDPVMSGMAVPLSEQDIADIGAYYAAQEPPQRYIGEEQVADARRGERVYRGGYRPFSIAACMGCHGPGGHGIPPNYPRLSGQQAAYLEKQLLAFKSGDREHEIMNPIAFKLSEDQIRDIALYVSALE